MIPNSIMDIPRRMKRISLATIHHERRWKRSFRWNTQGITKARGQLPSAPVELDVITLYYHTTLQQACTLFTRKLATDVSGQDRGHKQVRNKKQVNKSIKSTTQLQNGNEIACHTTLIKGTGGCQRFLPTKALTYAKTFLKTAAVTATISDTNKRNTFLFHEETWE